MCTNCYPLQHTCGPTESASSLNSNACNAGPGDKVQDAANNVTDAAKDAAGKVQDAASDATNKAGADRPLKLFSPPATAPHLIMYCTKFAADIVHCAACASTMYHDSKQQASCCVVPLWRSVKSTQVCVTASQLPCCICAAVTPVHHVAPAACQVQQDACR